MTDLRKAAEQAIEAIMHGGMKEQAAAVYELRQALAQAEKPPVKSYCGGKPNYCTPVDAVNMSQEPVDETVKREHEPFIYVREDNERPFGGYEHCSEADAGAFPVYTAPMIYTPRPKREWVGLTHEERDEIDQTCRSQMEALFAIESKLKEKNGG